jgi:hypothetical protein
VKVGADNSKKTMVAVGLFAIALFLLIRMFTFGGPSHATASPAPNAASTTMPNAPGQRAGVRRVRPTSKSSSAGPLTPSLDPRLHLSELKQTENTEYTGKGRNIFLAQATEPIDIPKPIVSPIKNPKVTPPPQQVYTPPPPPPIDLKFFGFASTQGVKRVFLARGDDVFVATEGDIVNRRYKIVKINNNNIEVLDVLNNNRQTIPLTS